MVVGRVGCRWRRVENGIRGEGGGGGEGFSKQLIHIGIPLDRYYLNLHMSNLKFFQAA